MANEKLIKPYTMKLELAFIGCEPKYLEAVERCATVDAVEVVRCKDCKHWEDGYLGCCTKTHTAMDYDAFCSYGERRNDENT